MKKITLLLSFAILLVVAGCGKTEEPAPAAGTTGAAAAAPPETPGGAQRQGGLPAPTLNQGAGNIDSFGSKAGG